jgi:hypothetical protein
LNKTNKQRRKLARQLLKVKITLPHTREPGLPNPEIPKHLSLSQRNKNSKNPPTHFSSKSAFFLKKNRLPLALSLSPITYSLSQLFNIPPQIWKSPLLSLSL